MTCDGVFEMMKLSSVTDGSPRRRSMSLIVWKNWIFWIIEAKIADALGIDECNVLTITNDQPRMKSG